MNVKKTVLLALATAMTISVATAAEAVWPKNSVSEISTFATILRFQIYADHCSGEIPQLEAKFNSLMENLSSRIQSISTSLLASGEFNGMKDKLVPVEIIDALKHSFHDVTHNVERLDAASICSKALQNFGEIDNEALKAALTANLTAVQNMSQNLEKARVR
jgi:glutathionylspermidine synthase